MLINLNCLSSSSSLSLLVKLEQLDLGSNVLEVLVRTKLETQLQCF